MKRETRNDAGKGGHASKLTVAVVGVVMVGFALVCAAMYDSKKTTLLDFALGVMTFALSGMLAVFLTALLTWRGSSMSVVAALVTGVMVVGLMQDRVMGWWSPWVFGGAKTLAWPWWMPVATGAAFLVCITGRSPDEAKNSMRS